MAAGARRGGGESSRGQNNVIGNGSCWSPSVSSLQHGRAWQGLDEIVDVFDCRQAKALHHNLRGDDDEVPTREVVAAPNSLALGSDHRISSHSLVGCSRVISFSLQTSIPAS